MAFVRRLSAGKRADGLRRGIRGMGRGRGGPGEGPGGSWGGGLGGWGWGVAYQCPSSTPISTGSRQASRGRDAPTLNPAKTARASLESATWYCLARRGRGGRRRGRQEAFIAQLFTGFAGRTLSECPREGQHLPGRELSKGTTTSDLHCHSS